MADADVKITNIDLVDSADKVIPSANVQSGQEFNIETTVDVDFSDEAWVIIWEGEPEASAEVSNDWIVQKSLYVWHKATEFSSTSIKQIFYTVYFGGAGKTVIYNQKSGSFYVTGQFESTKGTRGIKTNWPHTSGLIAGSTKQKGRISNLIPMGHLGKRSGVLRRNRYGI